MDLILRTIEEIRFGVRELDLEDLRLLASTWSLLNEGYTPTEAVLRLSKEQQ
jgi:hypothetical protein